jgi:hypothetical protein
VYLNERANQELHIEEGLSFLDKWKLLPNSKLRTVNQSYSLVPHCPQEVNVGTQTSPSYHTANRLMSLFQPHSAAPLAKRCLSQSPMHSVNISITGPASLHGFCYKALKIVYPASLCWQENHQKMQLSPNAENHHLIHPGTPYSKKLGETKKISH